MKKLLVLVLVVVVYGYWGDIRGAFGPAPDTAASADTDVVLYATSWCGYCQKTRELFAEHGIRYIEYDVEESETARREFDALGGRGVPLVTVGHKVVRGYDEQAILALVK